MAKKVYQYDTTGCLLRIFRNTNEAVQFFSVSKQYISSCCYRVKNLFCKGYLLSYVPMTIEQDRRCYNDKSYNRVLQTKKIDGLSDILKSNIDKIDCGFTKRELKKLYKIKRKKHGFVATGL